MTWSWFQRVTDDQVVVTEGTRRPGRGNRGKQTTWSGNPQLPRPCQQRETDDHGRGNRGKQTTMAVVVVVVTEGNRRPGRGNRGKQTTWSW